MSAGSHLVGRVRPRHDDPRALALGLDAGEYFRRPLADRLSDDKDLKGGLPARMLSQFCDK